MNARNPDINPHREGTEQWYAWNREWRRIHGPPFASEYERGRTDERSVIVAYLRSMSSEDEANEIERGEHLKLRP